MKASVVEHLAELRRRIILVLAVFAVSALLSYPVSKPILSIVKDDLLADVDLVVLGPQEAILTYVKVSLLIGFSVALPFITYHAWAFIAPGLLKRERRLIAYLVLPSAFLFLAGVAFGYFVLLPVALTFLVASASGLAEPMLSLSATFGFIATVLFALGVIFQLPLVTAALTKLGVLDAGTLTKYRRHAIVLILLAAALITDPSIITQLLLAVPMLLLYEAGILTSKLMGGVK